MRYLQIIVVFCIFVLFGCSNHNKKILSESRICWEEKYTSNIVFNYYWNPSQNASEVVATLNENGWDEIIFYEEREESNYEELKKEDRFFYHRN